MVIDARNDALDFGRLECPRENQFARAFGESAALSFRPHRAQDLEVLPIERLRSDQPANSQRHATFHDDEEPVGAACTWLGQRAEELPDVLLNLEGLKQSVVRSVERQELHGSIRRSARGRAAPEADDVAIGVLDVEVLRAPRGRGKRLDDRYAVRCALLIERLDAVNTRRRVEMLVHTPVSAVFGVLGRFLQVKLQPVQLTDRVKPVPRLAECKDRKSTRLNSSHITISYAVFCLKKKKHKHNN